MLNHNERMGQLRSKGYTLEKAARIITEEMSGRCTKQALSMVLRGDGKSKRLQKDLAILMGLPYNIVWGDCS